MDMGAIAILLVLGICVFLLWFFEAIVNDLRSDDDVEYRYADTRVKQSMRPPHTEYAAPVAHLYRQPASDENVYTRRAS